MENQVKKLLASLQKQLCTTLESNRETLCHPTSKGDATEDEWLCLLKNHLPNRYQADKAFVIDATGQQSDQIDIIIYDRQYTPLLYNQNKQIFIPAESVYAVLEVKQTLNVDNLLYAGRKIASVRNLKRTSSSIVDVGKSVAARPIPPILGGILATNSSWIPAFGDAFKRAISLYQGDKQIDFGIALSEGAFNITYKIDEVKEIKIEAGDDGLLYFFFNLLYRLQGLGTVPAIDYKKYLEAMSS
jgi:hypothetical protein